MRHTHRHWRELSRTEQGAIVAAAALQVAMAADAWWDLSRRPAGSVRGPKGAWALAIAVNFLGPLAYRRFGRKPVVEPEPAHP
ncbi:MULTISPECIES: PLDc N-terminal domain-containing protein [Amycolatopsis]|uniref:Phospholipase D-like protein n=1 Tax=Amycolatopsis thermoflava TaxID=84480 RepID=A0A3N2G5U3_9PSEU|nr:PLDc N-terminal domain-containing protein [Amycolatopsis thermoflava]ROS32011.1 phospholipase D-like protein [Amycolatopsis thermoflava]